MLGANGEQPSDQTDAPAVSVGDDAALLAQVAVAVDPQLPAPAAPNTPAVPVVTEPVGDANTNVNAALVQPIAVPVLAQAAVPITARTQAVAVAAALAPQPTADAAPAASATPGAVTEPAAPAASILTPGPIAPTTLPAAQHPAAQASAAAPATPLPAAVATPAAPAPAAAVTEAPLAAAAATAVPTTDTAPVAPAATPATPDAPAPAATPEAAAQNASQQQAGSGQSQQQGQRTPLPTPQAPAVRPSVAAVDTAAADAVATPAPAAPEQAVAPLAAPAPVAAPVAAAPAVTAAPITPLPVVTAPAVPATPAAAAVPTIVLSHAGMGATVERIHDLVRVAGLRDGNARATLQLKPAELGSVNVHLRTTANGLVASIHAQDLTALAALKHAGADLQQTLQDRGINLARIELQLSSDAGSTARDRRDSMQAFADGRGSGGGRGHRDLSTSGDVIELAVTQTETVPTTHVLADGSLVDVQA